jgi:type I restriction enzyme S subunit
VSPVGRNQIYRFDNGSAQPNLSANSVQLYIFPLPPLAEQKRIVAKVDELMKLCDQLEASLRESQQRAESLAASAISHLTI